ncbi:uncharacterized protein [Dysidea avara]|uniref:uncharacterized protein n=1 Tax=Dysidea avara TaxID=196820 RepID=UPI00332C1561
MSKKVLNEAVPVQQDGSSWEPVQLAVQLQKDMLKLKGEYMSDDGRSVDYVRLKNSDTFKDYIKQTCQLHYLDLTKLSLTERKAFFINVYNSLTIHGLADCDQLPSSVLEVKDFWANTCYNIGGLVFSLDDMEHGILRGNRPHPSVAHKQQHHFSQDDDPRTQLAMSSVDPRVHFALVCGAKSCPAIQVYTSDNLDRALEGAARSFCGQEVNVEGNKVTVSKILEWYASDFGANENELLSWISKYLPNDLQQQLVRLLSDNEPITIDSRPYNWTLNH